jgi:thymidylate synthase (FAD)
MPATKIGNAGFVECLDVFGDDLTVVNAARVSFAKESAVFEPRDEKLVTSLLPPDGPLPTEDADLRGS